MKGTAAIDYQRGATGWALQRLLPKLKEEFELLYSGGARVTSQGPLRGLAGLVDEGVGVVGVDDGELVVDVAVGGLVRAHREQQVTHAGVRPEAPVELGDVGRGEALPGRQLAGVQVLDGLGVGVHRLLLQVAHKGVAGAGRDDVG